MALPVYPELLGLEWPVRRRPTFRSLIESGNSQREVNSLLMSNCQYEFELSYELLRSTGGFTELQQIEGLFLNMRGGYGSFLYRDPNDWFQTTAQIGTGNASNKVFILARNTGPNYYEAISYLNTISAVYLNGVLQSGGSYTISLPNVITFNTAPGAGVVVTATFTYYYHCRFLDDEHQYDEFYNNLYENKSVKFRSVPA